MGERRRPAGARPLVVIPARFSASASALRYRAQAPLVDQLLREIGIEGGDIQRLVGGVSGAQVALPPAPGPTNE